MTTDKEIRRGSNYSGRTGQEQDSPKKERPIKIGKHGADVLMTTNPARDERMLNDVGLPLGMEPPATIEERIRVVQRVISQSMGITLSEDEVPTRIGFDISTDAQRKILFAVLRLMSEDDYQGSYKVPNSQFLNREFENRTEPVKALSSGFKVKATGTEIGGAYQNIPSTPILKITRGDLMREAGFDTSGSDVSAFENGLKALGFQQNFVMWTRFKRDDKGRVIKKNGRTQFENVAQFSPVLNIRAVSDPTTNRIDYYEISPAPVFLDEISREYGAINGRGYFVLIPVGAYQEVSEAYRRRYPFRRGLTPDKIQAFCYWLRLKVQEIQNRESNPLTKYNRERASSTERASVLRIGFRDLCQELRYNETTIVKQRKRISQTLLDGISVALDLGYLNDYSIDATTGDYLFDLNLDFYPSSSGQEAVVETPALEAPDEVQGSLDLDE